MYSNERGKERRRYRGRKGGWERVGAGRERETQRGEEGNLVGAMVRARRRQWHVKSGIGAYFVVVFPDILPDVP